MRNSIICRVLSAALIIVMLAGIMPDMEMPVASATAPTTLVYDFSVFSSQGASYNLENVTYEQSSEAGSPAPWAFALKAGESLTVTAGEKSLGAQITKNSGYWAAF